MDIQNLAQECMGCRACGRLAARQTWPLLGYFPATAKILVIGQNPAVSKYAKESIEFSKRFKDRFNETDPIEYLDWYGSWLKNSTMTSTLNSFLGKDWIFSGNFAVTNAVRCRTKSNSRPSDMMLMNCQHFTEKIIQDYRYIIVMGGVARKQMKLAKKAVKAPMILHFLAEDRYILYINHYAWRPRDGSDRSAEIRETKKFVRFALNNS